MSDEHRIYGDILPVDEHDFTDNCQCKPSIVFEDDKRLIIHNDSSQWLEEQVDDSLAMYVSVQPTGNQ